MPPERRFGSGSRVVRIIAIVFGLVLVGIVAIETAKFVKVRVAPALAPILAAAFVLTLFAAVLYFLWHFCADPTRRLAERARDEFDYRREHRRTANELERRIAAIEEEQRVRALTATARVHESATLAVADGNMQLALEDLKHRSEQVVMSAQSVDVARMLARYEAAFFKLKNAQHMNAAEKTLLLEEMRAVLADDATRPEPPTEPVDEPAEPSSRDWRAKPPPRSGQISGLEYRSPGGQPISVTAEGLRRLLAGGQLSGDDECRRIGALDWTSVREILEDAAQD